MSMNMKKRITVDWFREFTSHLDRKRRVTDLHKSFPATVHQMFCAFGSQYSTRPKFAHQLAYFKKSFLSKLLKQNLPINWH